VIPGAAYAGAGGEKPSFFESYFGVEANDANG